MKQLLIFYICTMSKEDEILYLLRENNKMLKEICGFLMRNGQSPEEDFITNVVANIVGNKIDLKR